MALEPLQRRIKRAVIDPEDVARALLYAVCDAVAVRRTEEQRAQDEQVECALQEFYLLLAARFFRQVLIRPLFGRLSTKEYPAAQVECQGEGVRPEEPCKKRDTVI